MEDFGRLLERRICARNVQESEARKLAKEREMGLQMMDEIGEGSPPLLNIGERHHRGGRRGFGLGKHWELVDEISNRWTGPWTADIEPGGKSMLLDAESAAEETDLFRFRFKVRIGLVLQDKIEDGNALPNEIH